ncbi:MAG: BatD family protein [Culturomica sp.]|jgi:hypothetical protein|nr:BatD family protein [Culturomica sp.]
MNRTIRLIGLFACILTFLTAAGQPVEFKASAPSVVEVGEQFRLSFSVNRQGTDLQVPTLEGFNLLMGPSTSSSSSISMINGTTTRSVNYTYTYVLEGVKEGTFRVPAATIVADGQQYRSNTLEIQVIKGSGEERAAGRGNNNRSGQGETPASINEENLFVRVEVSKRNLYLGESLVATLKVYSRVDLQRFGRSKFPSFDGFLAEELSSAGPIELKRENYDGKIYNVGVLRRVLLFPQHTGDITIEPLELECIVRQQLAASRSFFDDFFGNYREISFMRISRPQTIHVRELPAEGRPLGFGGTVGNITMRNSLSADTVSENEALTYRITFQGTGNLKLLEAPALSFPPDFETYEPKVTQNTETGENGMSGTVTYEYLLIPRYGGDYTIPSPAFSYYDPVAHSYKTLSGKEFQVHVRKGRSVAGATAGEGTVHSFKKEEVRQLGQDIRFIRTGDLKLHTKGTLFFGTPFFALACLIPLLVFVAGVLITRKRIRENADLAKVKNKAANKMARKRMKAASAAMKQLNAEQFYEEVLNALWGYVSYKLNIDKSKLNRDNISELLEQKSVGPETIREFIGLLDTCEFARYAPGGETEQTMEQVYGNGIAVITRLDKTIR